MKKIKLSGLSDKGMVRKENEDNFLIHAVGRKVFIVVADGMGGQAGGKDASRTVVETFKEYVDLNQDRLGEEELLNDFIILSNTRVRELAREKYQGRIIGSTCTAAVIREKKHTDKNKKRASLEVVCAHVGDSRLYYLHDKTPEQMTLDHTMLQKLIEADALSQQEIADYAHKNIVYKSINGDENFEPDPVKVFDIEMDDALLFCTDGLYNDVAPEEFTKAIQGTDTLNEAADYLVNLAKYRGGEDNITVVLLEYGNYHRPKEVELEKIPKIRRNGWRKKRNGILAGLFVLLFAAVGMMWLVLNENKTTDIPVQNKPAVRRAALSLRSKPISLPASTDFEDLNKLVIPRIQDISNTNNVFNKESLPRFIIEDDGAVVKDNITGLMWSLLEFDFPLSYQDAEDIVSLWNIENRFGYNDWRLPTIEEAVSLLKSESNMEGLFIDQKLASWPEWIWTADTVSEYINQAWKVGYVHGFKDYLVRDDKTSLVDVRFVRKLNGGNIKIPKKD